MTKLIAIAVVEHNNHFLVGQRPAGVPLAGLWEFPGGKVESGESCQQGAVRECEEETGLKIRVVGELLTNTHEYSHDRVELHFFLCHLNSEGIEPRHPYRWIEREELAHLAFPSGNNELLAQLIHSP
jgi:8-oxo-dGTP diphosphatase